MDEAYAVVEVTKDAVGKWVDFRFLHANRAFMEHTSMPYPVGRTATELLGSPNPRWTELYGQVLDTGQSIRIEETEHALGRIIDLNIFTLDRERNRVAVLFSNISERKRAESILRESEKRQAFLLKLRDVLRSLDDPDDVADAACRSLVKGLQASRAQYTVMIDDTSGAEVAEVRGESLRFGDRLVRRFEMNAFGEGARGPSPLRPDGRRQQHRRQHPDHTGTARHSPGRRIAVPHLCPAHSNAPRV